MAVPQSALYFVAVNLKTASVLITDPSATDLSGSLALKMNSKGLVLAHDAVVESAWVRAEEEHSSFFYLDFFRFLDGLFKAALNDAPLISEFGILLGGSLKELSTALKLSLKICTTVLLARCSDCGCV